MGRKDREFKRRQRRSQASVSEPSHPETPDPSPGDGTVTVPESRVKDWLDALQAAKSDQAELRRLRSELEESRARIRHLENKLAELDRNLGRAAR
jgi:hypothetical protein